MRCACARRRARHCLPDTPFSGVLMTHTFALRPGGGRFWIGPAVYLADIRAKARQRGENAGASSFTGGYGVGLGVDLGNAMPQVALELAYRHLESELTDISSASFDEDAARFDDVMMRISILFGRAAPPPASSPVQVVPVVN